MCTHLAKLAMGGALLLVALTLPAAIATAATPGELLEKAIYTEETVGDLDKAIELYEKVIAEGKAGEQAAAQAQYRLAECYLKQGKQDEATAAFRTLIEEYPGEKELAAKAEKHLPGKLELLPVPWKDGERLQMNMKLPTGLDIGTMIYMIDSADHEGREVWRCSARGLVTINDASSYSWVLCDKETFSPIRSNWKHDLLGEALAVYHDTEVEINVNGKDEPITLEFKPPVFDNEQGVQLFRRLPLEIGYKASIPIVTSLGANKIDIPVNVETTETLTVPAGTFECYKLVLGLVNQTFWVSNDEHRYVVRFAAGGVTAELAKVDQAQPGELEEVSGSTYSFTLPAGWLSYQPEETSKKQEGQEALLLDPQAKAESEVEVRPISSLKKEQQASPKAWTESVLDDFKNVYTDFSIREPGLRDIEVDGRPATAVVADYTNAKHEKRTMYGVAVFGDSSAATLRLSTDADSFDELQKEFQKVVESFKLE